MGLVLLSLWVLFSLAFNDKLLIKHLVKDTVKSTGLGKGIHAVVK